MPVRLPSGHRRYTAEHVRWIRRISEALAAGHRPSELVLLDDAELDRLLERLSPAETSHQRVLQLLDLVTRQRFDDLRKSLHKSLENEGRCKFLDQVLAPFLATLGRGWSDGLVQIRHEHMVTQIAEDLLRSLRQKQKAGPGTGLILLATLKGELHGLGLLMAAALCADKGRRFADIGVDLPLAEIADAAVEQHATAVGIGISLASGGIETDRRLKELRTRLPSKIHLLVGGAGAQSVRRRVPGIAYMSDLRQFEAWLDQFPGPNQD